jgi:hypothetical protein
MPTGNYKQVTERVDPRAEYGERLKLRRDRLSQEGARSRRFWTWRRVVFAAGIALVFTSLAGWTSPLWLIPPVVIFIGLMAAHERVRRALELASRSVAFYERGIARIEDRWAGSGDTGERFADRNHLYSEDLDLFGRASLFELLSTARTSGGEEMLAGWLLQSATIDEIGQRQEAVTDLRPRLDLQEELALLGADVRASVHPGELIAWGGGSPIHFAKTLPFIALVLGAATFASIVMWLAFGLRWLALSMLLAEILFLMVVRQRVTRVITDIELPRRDLRLLGEILGRLEREEFSSKLLTSLRSRLSASPSHEIARLYRLLEILDSTKNVLFGPLAFVLLVPAQIAFAIERWRQRWGDEIRIWIEIVAEFEALASIAAYSFEHPDDPFPELVAEGAVYEGTGVAHPLLPRARAVANDVSLTSEQPARAALVVSGSNMSGKSTMLRTVGINAVLAQAGAPVRAKRLRLSRLAIGASIHILDSLQEGSSRFYAEITRLRQIVELTRNELPVLFLLDEILSGTNSHDRRVGAEKVVRGLINRGAIGLLTTHDLALTDIAENVHFEDHLEDGRLSFDYRMRPGVVRKSNALELMRAVGLDV